MKDTPDYIIRKQFDIIHSKPLAARLKMMTEMTELSWSIIKNQIRKKAPHLSEGELKIEVFKIFYKSDFDQDTMDKIIDSLAEYHKRKK